MPFEGGFTFANFLADALAVFFFIVWFWLLIIVFGDLFRRHDISGWGKALWVVGLILFPLPWRVRIHDLSIRRHGGASHPPSPTGTR
jgi:hypothetical protein